ncbi:type II toxin-antitoxin system RelE/ParE family toxin [archaeon]|jgi:Txe/YoeB family toxin of Txe-Axe toxin-antitoxin module|nr:type II toxin-antitoxin system RelE/ParE family toxin [archaeon]MBT3450595.1 type II toxin-antitoxin system RelE/ParE family toxin [archaeon]MBT6868719.1 type II toxin-antitoxin system RelE/ParE family toxin [archaeon]MBT7193507.1 type II toxin-antitoxin system RelE/ParE family toxin [archaeon]MBT7381098.1 type II toxin-antitoxin system RelE/ParE family toxin [archaeon]
MKLESTLRFADDKIKEAFYKLETGDDQERELFKLINQAMDNLEENAFCGIQIPKKLIPKEYLQKYDVKNIWKYDLPRGWRLIYSILNEEIIVVSLVLEWFDHKNYERRFKY